MLGVGIVRVHDRAGEERQLFSVGLRMIERHLELQVREDHAVMLCGGDGCATVSSWSSIGVDGRVGPEGPKTMVSAAFPARRSIA